HDFTHQDAVRLRRIEQKLDLILAHLGIAFTETSSLAPEVRDLADRGDKIGAIKLHRQATGAGVAAAKQEVEDHMAGNPRSPRPTAMTPAGRLLGDSRPKIAVVSRFVARDMR